MKKTKKAMSQYQVFQVQWIEHKEETIKKERFELEIRHDHKLLQITWI